MLIDELLVRLEDSGYRKDAPPQKAGVDHRWHSRKIYRVLGSDCSILEIYRSNVYTRVVCLTESPEQFAYYRFASIDYPWFPKTEFYIFPTICPHEILDRHSMLERFIAELNSPE